VVVVVVVVPALMCISSSPTNSLDGSYLLLEGRPRVCLVCPSY